MENNERPMMGETEKRFKIQKIKKYEEMIDEIEKFNTVSVVAMGIFSIIIMFDVFMAGYAFNNNNLTLGVVEIIVALVGSVIPSNYLKILLDGISKKTSLQNNIDMLKDELELNDALEEETKTKTL